MLVSITGLEDSHEHFSHVRQPKLVFKYDLVFTEIHYMLITKYLQFLHDWPVTYPTPTSCHTAPHGFLPFNPSPLPRPPHSFNDNLPLSALPHASHTA